MPKTDTNAEPGAVTAPQPICKSAAVVELLSRADGATLDDITNATGWQNHTARAVLTGLKKKGHTIERTKEDGVSRYRITGSADQ
jgi:DNA-binding IclR family transcriptional regulator